MRRRTRCHFLFVIQGDLPPSIFPSVKVVFRMGSSSSLLDRTVPVKTGGRPAIHPRRRIVEAILYVDRIACARRMMPRDFHHGRPCTGISSAGPPTGRQTGSTRRCAQPFGMRAGGARGPRLGSGFPVAQSCGTVGPGSRGYDAGNKTNWRKRHIVVDTRGLLVVVLVTAQDPDGGGLVPDKARMKMPSIVLV